MCISKLLQENAHLIAFLADQTAPKEGAHLTPALAEKTAPTIISSSELQKLIVEAGIGHVSIRDIPGAVLQPNGMVQIEDEILAYLRAQASQTMPEEASPNCAIISSSELQKLIVEVGLGHVPIRDIPGAVLQPNDMVQIEDEILAYLRAMVQIEDEILAYLRAQASQTMPGEASPASISRGKLPTIPEETNSDFKSFE